MKKFFKEFKNFAIKGNMIDLGEKMEEVAIGYGELIESLVDFCIIAFTIFVMVKFINRFKEKSEDPANKEVETPKNIALLASVESLLKEQNEILRSKR